MGAGASSAIGMLNFGSQMAGLGAGLASIIISAQTKQIINQMNDLVTSNKGIIDSYNAYENIIKVTASQTLSNQLDKVKILLTSNVKDIQEYFQILRRTQLGDPSINMDYNQIMSTLPGSVPAWMWGINSLQLFGQIIFTLFSMKQAFNLYKQWKSSIGSEPEMKEIDVVQVPAFQETSTQGGQSICSDISNSFLEGNSNISSDNISESISNEFNTLSQGSGDIEQSIDFSISTESESIQISRTISSSILSIAGAIMNLANVALAIYGIINEQEQKQEAEKQLQDLQNKINNFYTLCSNILDNIQKFIESFFLSVASFSIFLTQLRSIANFNLLASAKAKDYIDKVNSLNIDDIINPTTFTFIEDSKNKLHDAMQGFDKNESHNILADRFSKVTPIFQDLDKNINISLIFNSFYDKLNAAEDVYTGISFKDSTNFAQFIQLTRKYVKINSSVQTIEVGYQTLMTPDSQTLSQQDKEKIAMAISLFAKQFPPGQTSLYGYNYADFHLKVDQKDKISVNPNTQIQDIDLSYMMPDWVKSQKQISLQKIAQSQKIDAKTLKYEFSTFYLENQGDLNKENWISFRVQIFSDSKNIKYYALYNGATNVFYQVRVNNIETTTSQFLKDRQKGQKKQIEIKSRKQPLSEQYNKESSKAGACQCQIM